MIDQTDNTNTLHYSNRDHCLNPLGVLERVSQGEWDEETQLFERSELFAFPHSPEKRSGFAQQNKYVGGDFWLLLIVQK